MSLKKYIYKGLVRPGLLPIWRSAKNKRNVLTIICFHRISDENSYVWPPLPTNDFERILQYLVKYYDVIRPDDIINKTPWLVKPLAMITFDDGYKDFMLNALPLLKKYRLPAVQSIVVNSVVTGEQINTQRLNNLIDGYIKHKVSLNLQENQKSVIHQVTTKTMYTVKERLMELTLNASEDEKEELLLRLEAKLPEHKVTEMMNWGDLRECMEQNIDIASHTMSHPLLDEISKDNAQLNYELDESKLLIEKNINHPVTCISFPRGHFNQTVVDASIKAGYQLMLTTQQTCLPQTEFNSTKSFHLLPRIMMDRHYADENICKLEGLHHQLLFNSHRE